MDITKQNILMFEKAWEIQKEWKPIIGDFYAFDGSKSIVGIPHSPLEIEGFLKGYSKGSYIWLPRQDQLQGMIKKPLLTLLSSFKRFYGTKGIYPSAPMVYFTFMEQLWLAFVMKEKYNKIWDGEDWVKA